VYFYNLLGVVSSTGFHISHRFIRMDPNISFPPKKSVKKDRTRVDAIKFSRWQINKAYQNKIDTEKRIAKLENAIGRLRVLKNSEDEYLKRIEFTTQINEQKLLSLVSPCLLFVVFYIPLIWLIYILLIW